MVKLSSYTLPSWRTILSVYLSVISVSLQSALYLLILLPYTTPPPPPLSINFNDADLVSALHHSKCIVVFVSSLMHLLDMQLRHDIIHPYDKLKQLCFDHLTREVLLCRLIDELKATNCLRGGDHHLCVKLISGKPCYDSRW